MRRLLPVLLILLLLAALALWPPSGSRETVEHSEPDGRMPAGGPARLEGSVRAPVPPAPETRAPETAATVRGRAWVVPEDGGPLTTSVPGAVVRAWLVRGDVIEPLGEVRANDAGAFDLPLARLAALSPVQRAAAKVRLLGWAEGFGPEYGPDGWQEFPLAGVASGDRIAEDVLLLEQTDAIEGRVVDAEGAPAADATVVVWPAENRADPPLFGLIRPTDPDGRFRAWARPGSEYLVEARQTGLGTGMLDRIRVPPEGGTLKIPDLVLWSPTSIAGEVRFPDGSPASRVQVVCRPEHETGRPWPPEPGLLFGEARTDDTGRFRIEGLGRYAYRVVCEGAGGWTGSDAQVADGASGPAVAHLCAKLPRVRLRLEDEAGRPVPGAGYQIDRQGHRPSDGVVKAADGTVSLWCEHDRPLLVTAWCETPTVPPVEAEIVVPEGRWSEDVTLVLRAIDPRLLGQVEVSVRWPDGTPAGPFCASLSSPLAGALYARSCSVEGTRGDVLTDVAPGRWRLAVWQDRHTRRTPERRWQTWRREIDVAPGEIVDVVAEVTPE